MTTQRQAKRAARRLDAGARRELKARERVEREAPRLAREWLERHPPRAAPPVELGKWAYDTFREGERGSVYEVDFFGMRQRDDRRWAPEAAVVQVPVMDRRYDSVLSAPGEVPGFARQMIHMRPIQMGLQHGQTRVRWWNWEPTQGAFAGEVESDLYRAASKMSAMLGRVKQIAEQSGLLRSLLDRPFYEERMATEGLEFVGEFLEALEQWMGRARTVYSVPGWSPGSAEEWEAR